MSVCSFLFIFNKFYRLIKVLAWFANVSSLVSSMSYHSNIIPAYPYHNTITIVYIQRPLPPGAYHAAIIPEYLQRPLPPTPYLTTIIPEYPQHPQPLTPYHTLPLSQGTFSVPPHIYLGSSPLLLLFAPHFLRPFTLHLMLYPNRV